MKKYFSLLMLALCVTGAVFAQNSTPAAAPARPEWEEKALSLPQTKVEFGEDKYQFGQVKTGSTVTHRFTFVNTGAAPLTLTRVKASCGCTTPMYSKEAIQPGKEGFIDVSFNTTGKSGMQTKTVTVSGNFDGLNKILMISGEVLPAEAATDVKSATGTR
ncbi:MAG: DUF1573 domain-containing protein [Bacteroidia bacterium]|nr:DUF1573 domain-containing protein [Bacteroidia bacterium]